MQSTRICTNCTVRSFYHGRESLTPMIQKVQQAIEEVGKEHGFTYIFDSSMGATLYNGGEDVSSLVKTKLGNV